MQDITEHLKDLNRVSKNNKILESLSIGVLGTEKQISESLKISISDDEFKDMSGWDKLEPRKRREAVLLFIKKLYIGLKLKDSTQYKDFGLWSASTRMLDWILKTEFKNDAKAKDKLAYAYKAVKGLKDYNTTRIDKRNSIFSQLQPVLKGQVLDLVKDPVLKNLVRNHDEFTHLFLDIWGEEVGVGYNPDKKEDRKKIEDAFKPIKKLYDDFEIVHHKSGRGLLYIQGGNAKAYLKATKEYDKKLSKMIQANND